MSVRQLKAEPDLLRSDVVLSDERVGVDRTQSVIRGYVVAQVGQFKTEGRGQFTLDSLKKLVQLGNENPRGVRSRFGHPNQSDDGLGKFLGRAKSFRLDGNAVRADLWLNETSLSEPPQGGRALGDYVMHLAETDPGAFSSSIVILADKKPIDGQPPVWIPTNLFASDVVDTGDAVDDFLSIDFLSGIPSGVVYEATKLIERQFAGQPRDVVEARLRAFLDKYLDHQFGPQKKNSQNKDESMTTDNSSDVRIQKLEEQAAETQKQLSGLTGSLTELTQQLKSDREEAQKIASAEQRAKRITALCAQCGVDAKLANEWIADESMTIDGVKDLLLQKKFESSKPAGDGGGSEQDTTDQKLAKEYDEFKSDHQAFGISKEEYIKMRKEEEDGEEFGGYMSPTWADKYREKALS